MITKVVTLSKCFARQLLISVLLILSPAVHAALVEGIDLDLLNRTEAPACGDLLRKVFPADGPSVFYQGLNDAGQVILHKPRVKPWEVWRSVKWSSRYSAKGKGFTPQGDPRWFIFLAGPELSQYFHFALKHTSNGDDLYAPGAQLLLETVLKLNQSLKTQGLDPIVFLPIKAEFATSEQTLNMSLSASGDFLAQFPYADGDKKLAPHEVSYHLGAMLFPREFHVKARSIDSETLRIVNFLRGSNFPKANQVANLLLWQRAYELDAGNANPVADLGVYAKVMRTGSKLKPFKWKELAYNESFMATVGQSIDLLTRPGMSAREAVLYSIIYALHFNEDVRRALGATKKYYFDPGIEAQIDLKESDAYVYYKWIKQLMSDPSYATDGQSSGQSAEQWAVDLVESLDKRIADLILAFTRS